MFIKYYNTKDFFNWNLNTFVRYFKKKYSFNKTQLENILYMYLKQKLKQIYINCKFCY